MVPVPPWCGRGEAEKRSGTQSLQRRSDDYAFRRKCAGQSFYTYALWFEVDSSTSYGYRLICATKFHARDEL
jgi:hypothetical protein